MNPSDYNSRAWDREVERGNRWTIPVNAEEIAAARNGRFEILLTPQRPVPMDWFGSLPGADVLCLASGGGQQGPILAAAGARVTVFDNSAKQLEQDQGVAARESLEMTLVQGDMTRPWDFADASFDLIFHPCSNCFIQHVRPVWAECHRVLRNRGALLAGFANPAKYIFDERKAEEEQVLEVRHSLPFSEWTDLTEKERQHFIDREEPLVASHTLDDEIGGQIDAGFRLVGFYEDKEPECVISRHMPTYIATRAIKSA